MAAEITLFKQSATDRYAQVAAYPFASYTATFTPASKCVARVYASGAPVLLTVLGYTWTVPSGTVEYFGLSPNDQVTVA